MNWYIIANNNDIGWTVTHCGDISWLNTGSSNGLLPDDTKPPPESMLIIHYNDVVMSALASQSTGFSIVCLRIGSGADQWNIKAPRHWPLCGEFTGDRWISRTKGQLRGKCFHLMTSSCNIHPIPDAIWRHGSWSTMVYVMAWCLAAPSHYLYQCWPIISEINGMHMRADSQKNSQDICLSHEFENDPFNITAAPQRPLRPLSLPFFPQQYPIHQLFYSAWQTVFHDLRTMP